MRWRLAGWLGYLALWSGAARAEVVGEGAEYWVEWRAPASCPDLMHLRAEVAARSPALRFAASGQRIQIEVTEEVDEGAAPSFRARAVMQDGAAREVRAARCGDLVSALAFIVVMDLDEDPPRPEDPPDDAPPWRPYLGLSAGLDGGRAPELMPTAGLFFELWKDGTALSYGMRASLVGGATELAAAPDTISVRFVGAALDVCPVGVFVLSLCGGLELGAARAQSGAALSNRQTTRFWMAGRLGAQVRWVFDDFWLGEVRAGVVLPTTLDAFAIQRRDGTVDEIHEAFASVFLGGSMGFRL